jgi:hypothetical protein
MNGLQKTLAWLAFLAALGAAAAVGLAGVGTRFNVWDYKFALGVLFRYGTYIAIAAGVVALIVLVMAMIRRKGGGAFVAVLALAAAGGAAYFPVTLMMKAGQVPPIHDISTDTENVPQFVSLADARKDPVRSPNGFDYDPKNAEQQAKAYPDIKTLTSTEPFNVLYDRALKLVREEGWILAGAAADEGRIEATATTAWFGFKDDVVIRVMPDGTGSKLDMRSMSRVGVSDIGANAERIRAFIGKLKG